MMMIAYSNEPFLNWSNGPTKVINDPKWVMERYVVNARVSDADIAAWRNQSEHDELLQSAMQNLLQERFKLRVHEQQTDIPVYNLVASPKGVKLKTMDPSKRPADGIPTRSGGIIKPKQMGEDTEWRFFGATMQDLAEFLGNSQRDPIRDATGLHGRYDFTILQPGQQALGSMEALNSMNFRRLGLDIKPGKGHGLNIVIDHVERPTPN
jgi:uncharacterized protein (TIGR03435 family)